MRRLLGVVAVVMTLMGYCKIAKADAKSLFAYGVNTSLALRQNSGESDNNEHSVMGAFGVQVKVLRFLGAELAYAPIGAGNREPIRFDNPWNASTLIYIVPTTPVGGYLKVGVGNSGLNRIFDFRGSEATYHAGAGVEVYATGHLVVGGEFLFLAPGLQPVVDDLTRENAPTRDVGYYVGVSNFRASLRASYFF